MSNIVIGIDTGATGAISMFVNGQPYKVVDMPAVTNAKGKLVVSACGLRDVLIEAVEWDDANVLVVIEDVHSMPKQGLASTFAFGVAKGMIVGVVEAMNIRYHMVSPQKWKRWASLSGTDKDFARALALREWPHLQSELKLKKHIDRADALWIGKWGITNVN